MASQRGVVERADVWLVGSLQRDRRSGSEILSTEAALTTIEVGQVPAMEAMIVLNDGIPRSRLVVRRPDHDRALLCLRPSGVRRERPMLTALGVIVVVLFVLAILAIVAFVLVVAVPVRLVARFVRRRASDLPLACPRFGGWRAPVPRAAAPAEAEALRAALQREAASGRPEALARHLRRFAPDWPAVATLTEVAAELAALQRNLAVARASGIPRAVTERLEREVRAATMALAARADRLAATAAFGIDSPLLREGLAREERELRRMVPAIREARAGLAELALAGADGTEACRRAEGQFRTLAAVTRELLDLAEPGWEAGFAPA